MIKDFKMFNLAGIINILNLTGSNIRRPACGVRRAVCDVRHVACGIRHVVLAGNRIPVAGRRIPVAGRRIPVEDVSKVLIYPQTPQGGLLTHPQVTGNIKRLNGNNI